MKKFFKVFLGCAMLAVLLVFNSYSPASAEAKAIDVYEDSFTVDLDGNGKDEEVSTRIEYTVDELINSVDVSINGKNVFSEVLENNGCIFQAGVYFTDINSKDKYKELVIYLGDEFSCNERVYRYSKKKLKLLFDTDWIGFLEGLAPEQEKGKNVLMYTEVTTPIGNNVYVITNNKIKKQKLKEIKPKNNIYTVAGDETWGVREYTLAKDAKIYTKSDGKKVKMTLEEGTDFILTKLKIVKGNVTFALISLPDGESEIGWLDLSQHSYEDPLVTHTSFAG